MPHALVRRTLALLADEKHVRLFDGAHEVACHRRSWGSGLQIEDPAHI